MKLSDIKGEAALDALADLMDPMADIAQDKVLVGLIRSKNMTEAIKLGLKKHQPSIITILAVLNQQDPNTYQPNLLEIPKMLLEILNDKEFLNLFQSQAETTEKTSSSSVTGNTGASEK